MTRSSTFRTRPRRDTTSTRSCGLRRSARASRGFISTQAFGDSRSRIGTLAGLRARVPVLDRAPGVEDERELGRSAVPETAPTSTGMQPRAAVVGLEPAVGVEPPRRAWIRRAGRERPLDAAVLLDRLVGHARVVAEAAGGNALPFLERVGRRRPAGEELVADAERRRRVQEDVEVGRAPPRAARTARLTLLTRRSELV